MTAKEVQTLETIAEVVVEAIRDALAPLRDEIKELRDRQTALEARIVQLEGE